MGHAHDMHTTCTRHAHDMHRIPILPITCHSTCVCPMTCHSTCTPHAYPYAHDMHMHMHTHYGYHSMSLDRGIGIEADRCKVCSGIQGDIGMPCLQANIGMRMQYAYIGMCIWVWVCTGSLELAHRELGRLMPLS